MSFNMPPEYLKSSPAITDLLILQAQRTIDNSEDPSRYQVRVVTDAKGLTTVSIADISPDSIYNEAMTGNLAKMRGK